MGGTSLTFLQDRSHKNIVMVIKGVIRDRNIACRSFLRRAFSLPGAILLAGVLFLPAAVRGESRPTTTTERICFVFTGSRASELESCGCHESQTGGVDREAYCYEQLRKTYPNLIAIEVGGWTDAFQTPNERLKTDYLLRALRQMRFSVFNVTPYDLVFGTTYPLQLTENGSGQLLSATVASTVFDKVAGTTTTQRLFAPYTILEAPRRDGRRAIRVGVIGMTHRESLEPLTVQQLKNTARQNWHFEVLDSSEVLHTIIPEVRKQADYVILLALMDRQIARRLMGQIEGVDLFVTAWGVQALRDSVRAGKTTFLNTGYWGRHFVQAVAEFDAGNHPIGLTGGMVDIRSDGPADPSITKLLEQYRENTKKLDRQMAVAREQSRYTGRTECISCHNLEYLQWTRTPHNLAIVTLVQKNQHYNPDCLACHAAAYGEADGFVDMTQTPHLVSVQCEACHGPARAHVKALKEMMKPDTSGTVRRPSVTDNYPHLVIQIPQALCLKCHVIDHDPDFNYERDLLLISHKNAQGPFRRQLARPPTTSATLTGSLTPASSAPPLSPAAPVTVPLTPK